MGRRHGFNQNNSSVYSRQEREKDNREQGYGTLNERLGADSVKEFDCCSLTLQTCKNPVITEQGYVFDKEHILEYILHHKQANSKKLKEFQKQRRKEEDEASSSVAAVKDEAAAKFARQEATPAHPGSSKDDTAEILQVASDQGGSVSNMAGAKAKQLPAFWMPSLRTKTAPPTKLQKPDMKVYCPLSKKPLKMTDLIPIRFTPIRDGNEDGATIGKTLRYMCPVTHDALTNATPTAALRTSGNVVTMECVNKVIRKDMVDPTNGKPLKEADIIPLQRGGTGFAATNDQLDGKKHRAVMELQ